MRKQLFEFLGLKRNTLALLVMVILIGMGERMAETFPADLSSRPGRRNSFHRISQRRQQPAECTLCVRRRVCGRCAWIQASVIGVQSACNPRISHRHSFPVLASRHHRLILFPFVDCNFAPRDDGIGGKESPRSQANDGSLDAFTRPPDSDGPRPNCRRSVDRMVSGKKTACASRLAGQWFSD